MRWIALFDDSPVMPEVRQKYEPAHLEYLRANHGRILIAGGLREGPEASFSAGLWVLAPMPREQAVELVERDPYFIHGNRSYKLYQWGKALQDIAVTL
ncbi:MAG: hypothetical protein JWL63_208 [Rhodocyclales bacterium]|nr:hypothetical protein [Rhodocyclales bacterium]